jgi:hypothetical protein
VGRAGKPRRFVAGFILAHHVALEEARCEGMVCVDPEVAVKRDDGTLKLWTMTGTLEGGDLTLNPSIECTVHPEYHAYVREGKWTGNENC